MHTEVFQLPPPPNFAKTHVKLGRGRLEVGCRDLIPPWGYTRSAGVSCRGSGLCRVGVLPGAGVGVPDEGEPPGRGLCRGRPAGAGGGVPGRRPCRGGWFFPGGGAKNIFQKALRACIRKPSTRFRQDWWIRLSLARFFGGFSRCYFRRKER